MTSSRRAIAAAVLFALCSGLAGVVPAPGGTEYRVFGLPAGMWALLAAWALVERQAWEAEGTLGWVAVGYGTLANAQLMERLLPGPGLLQWVVLTGLAVTAWGTLGTGSRKRLLVGLGSLALLLATLKFSVVPTLWGGPRATPGALPGVDALTEPLLRLVARPDSAGAAAQLTLWLALLCWAGATRLLWSAAPERADRPE